MMTLTLEILDDAQSTAPVPDRCKVFRQTGGTIGRLPENDWALPHPFVSSRHALIRYVDGEYLIEDMSRNGVFINSLDHRLTRGEPYALRAGDCIILDPFEIHVSMTSDVAERVHAFSREELSPDDACEPAPGGNDRSPALAAAEPDPWSLVEAGQMVDPLDLLGGATPPSKAAQEVPVPGRVGDEHFRPPRQHGQEGQRNETDGVAAGPAPRIPDNYDPLRSGDSVLVPSPDRVRQDQPASRTAPPLDLPHGHRGNARAPEVPLPPSPDVAARPSLPRAPEPHPAAPQGKRPPVPSRAGDLADVLAGAGLDGVAVTPELALQFGAILRIVVAGVMDVLNARQRLKEEFRMNLTTFKPADNNPLKFSANVEDALHNLLVKRNPAYLGPVEAFENAFDDVKDHQMALLAGVRTAYEAMLGQFHPAQLQEQFDRESKKGALLAVPGKRRYWDLYCERFHDIVGDPDTSFRELFGEEFAVAYEQQLARLKASRARGNR